MSQLARIKENVDWRNDNIIEETYATHLAFDSIEQIIDSKETEINDLILDYITKDEKFKIICRGKDINIDETTESIIRKIKNSNIEDKDAYIGKHEIWDDEYWYIIKEYDVLFVEENLIWSKEQAMKFFKNDIENKNELQYLWIELNNNEKDFLKIAIDCEIDTIKVEMM